MIIPPNFKVLGALGCAVLAHAHGFSTTLDEMRRCALAGQRPNAAASFSVPLKQSDGHRALELDLSGTGNAMVPPLVMGLDVGSVSAKGVVIDGEGRIIREDYRLSSGRPLEALDAVIGALTAGGLRINACAVTGKRKDCWQARLIEAHLIVNEISAQATGRCRARPAGRHHRRDRRAGLQVDIPGLRRAAGFRDESGSAPRGTGSFLMEQADRLGLPMGKEFSDAAFSSSSPSDLGTRCTVFMESDLIHHQNNGASQADLSAGVCISIVRNYLERVANHKRLGERTIFVGGVAANPAVRSAFQLSTGLSIDSPAFFKVSGALGGRAEAPRPRADRRCGIALGRNDPTGITGNPQGSVHLRTMFQPVHHRPLQRPGQARLQRRPLRSMGDGRSFRLEAPSGGRLCGPS